MKFYERSFRLVCDKFLCYHDAHNRARYEFSQNLLRMKEKKGRNKTGARSLVSFPETMSRNLIPVPKSKTRAFVAKCNEPRSQER